MFLTFSFLICEDYNLCEDCQEGGVHPHHNKMKQDFKQIYLLAMLVHAQICSMRVQTSQDCQLPHCLKMKEILSHIAIGHNRKSCKVSLCKPCSGLVQHWNGSDKQECYACLSILQALTSE